MLTLGGKTAMVAPVTGTTMVAHARLAGVGIAQACEDNEQLRELVRKAMTGGKYAGLGIFGVSILVAVAVDLGRIPPNAFVAQLVVGEQIQAVMEAQAAQAAASQNGSAGVPASGASSGMHHSAETPAHAG
jgi:hypothetical protein